MSAGIVFALAYNIVVVSSIIACVAGRYRLDLVLCRAAIALAGLALVAYAFQAEWLLATIWLFNGSLMVYTTGNVKKLAVRDEVVRDVARWHERIDEEEHRS